MRDRKDQPSSKVQKQGAGSGTSAVKRQPVPCKNADGQAVYDQEFFLSLARCGNNVWNAWRAENPLRDGYDSYISATFEGVDFRDEPNSEIDFSRFVFGHDANFSACQFGEGPRKGRRGNPPRFTPGMANFAGAIFEDGAQFRGTSFGRNANFHGARFGDYADFTGASFGSVADLSIASFGEGATFVAAAFGFRVNLSGATFGEFADFTDSGFDYGPDLSGVKFGDIALFSGASFGGSSNISEAVFEGWVSFTGRPTDQWRERREKLGREFDVDRWPQELKEKFFHYEPSPNKSERLSAISFAGTQFQGRADFSGRLIGGYINFTGAKFAQPPHFDTGVDFYGTDFYGATIRFTNRRLPWLRGWTSNSNIANQLRHLRRLADGSKNHDLERDLYIEERKAERGIYFRWYAVDGWRRVESAWRGSLLPFPALGQAILASSRLLVHLGWVTVMLSYWLLADYGRSLVRPFIALLVSIFVFKAAYWTLLEQAEPNDPTFSRAVRAVSISNALPFVGVLTLDKSVKEKLICGSRPSETCDGIPPLRFQVLTLAQTIFSALCLFFIALALRNYFRVR